MKKKSKFLFFFLKEETIALIQINNLNIFESRKLSKF